MVKLIKKFFAYDERKEVQNRELVDYAIGVFGQNHTYNLVSSWFMYFCTDVLFIDTLLIGTILGIARIWDAFNDPIVGVLVDRHTFKNGEKLRPWLRIMALPVGILTALMFVDWGLPQNLMGVYICLVYIYFSKLTRNSQCR